MTREQILEIGRLALKNVTTQLAEKDINLEVTEEAKNYLGNKGYDELFGARPLKRVIQDLVEDPISESLLKGSYKAHDAVKVDLVDDQIFISRLDSTTLEDQKNITALTLDA